MPPLDSFDADSSDLANEPIEDASPDDEPSADHEDLPDREELPDREDWPDGEAERWAVPQPTGVLVVDEAVADVARLDDLPTGEHVAIYDAVHRKLQDALAHLDGG